MGARYTIPIAGIALACLTFVALLLLGYDALIALAVLFVWIGSLLIAALRPPERPTPPVGPPPVSERQREVRLRDATIRKVIEDFSTPLLVTERGTIAIANRAAQRMLGQHIVGQDARVAFRQPEAIHLLSENRNGQALVRGLVRRQDIWQFNRHVIDGELAVLELINQTAEADLSRAHTDFVANASHELRTPLAAILGYVETLSDSSDTLDSPTSQKFLGTIEREAQRLQSLISDLMSLSRVEAEKHDLPTERLDLANLIERAARDAAGSTRMARLEFALEAGTPALEVHGDRQQLEQLVRNLVDNALKYGSPETPVRVEMAHAQDGRARITVIDRGEGIAPEQIPHLTRRFYRTDPGRSRASGGTGLGLAIVKHIVERHRGRLDIESDLGVGTRVIVRLPIAEPASPEDGGSTRALPAAAE
ncbi:MAG: ATP-binding protein [Erythrobacter sp.]|jgi:two-component system phosphate regulon sensor histidine kinase PhoR|nr:ATP-binding protein [Erythrobacter sp.]